MRSCCVPACCCCSCAYGKTLYIIHNLIISISCHHHCHITSCSSQITITSPHHSVSHPFFASPLIIHPLLTISTVSLHKMSSSSSSFIRVAGWEDGQQFERSLEGLDRWTTQSANTLEISITDDIKVNIKQDPHSRHLGGYISSCINLSRHSYHLLTPVTIECCIYSALMYTDMGHQHHYVQVLRRVTEDDLQR